MDGVPSSSSVSAVAQRTPKRLVESNIFDKIHSKCTPSSNVHYNISNIVVDCSKSSLELELIFPLFWEMSDDTNIKKGSEYL